MSTRTTLATRLGLFVLASSVVAVTASACSPDILDFDPDAGTASGAGAGNAASTGIGAGLPAPHPQICGTATCAPGEFCCYPTAECFDPAGGAATCPVADGGAGVHPAGNVTAGSPCSSDLECSFGQFCYGDHCLGTGACESPANDGCGDSSGVEFCGCDGVTYPNKQSVCQAGVHTAGEGACGHQGPDQAPNRVVCTSDSQCPTGFVCCHESDLCVDPAKPANCALAPPHTTVACTDDADCPKSFCWAPVCDGPKGCYRGSKPNCTSLQAPVCGCDGTTYRNWECALAAHVAVRHQFACH